MARYVLLPQTNLRVILSFLCKLNSYHFKKLPDIWRGPWFWSMVLVPSGPQLSACSCWDSGVRREGREREKNKKEKRERDLLTPTPPLVVFLCLLTPLCNVPTIWTPGTGYPVVYKDFSTRQGWSVKKPSLICQSGWSSKPASINSLSLLEINNKDLGAASQKLLAGLRGFTTCLSLIGYE